MVNTESTRSESAAANEVMMETMIISSINLLFQIVDHRAGIRL